MKKYSKRKSRGQTRRSDEKPRTSGRAKRSLSANVTRKFVINKKKKTDDSEDRNLFERNNVEDKISKIPKKVTGGGTIDNYCWICHLPILAAEFSCPEKDCYRAYHNKCLKKLKGSSNVPVCECRLFSIDGINVNVGKSEHLEANLICALQKVHKDPLNTHKKAEAEITYWYSLYDWPNIPKNKLLCQTVDIRQIADKIHMPSYKSSNQLFLDVKWIYHNCFIVYGPDNGFTQSALKFEKSVKQELLDLDACSECYRKKHSTTDQHMDFFTSVCANPHDIVWAKVKGFPFWPAKCLKLRNGYADVRFFGTHDKSIVPLGQVYKISHENPEKIKYSPRMIKYEESMKELLVYISNYQAEYTEGFKYYEKRTPLVEKSKTSGKRGSTGRRKSRSHPQDVSVNNDGHATTSALDKDQESTHLTVSFLHDVSEPLESKVGLKRLSNSISAENDTDSAENCSEPISNVVCHMTFDAEYQNEMNISDELIGENQSITEDAPTTCLNDSLGLCSNILSPEEVVNNTETTEIISDQFLHSNASANTAVITPAPPPFVITSTHSLNENNSDLLNINSSGNVNDDGSLATAAENLNKNIPQSIANQILQETISHDDEDISIIEENQSNNLVENVMRNSTMVKTLAELLLSNKPGLRRHLEMYQNVCLRLYLSMWLENSARMDDNNYKTFYMEYGKLLTKLGCSKEKIERLEKEVMDLKAKLKDKHGNADYKATMRKEIIASMFHTTAEKVRALYKVKGDLEHDLAELKIEFAKKNELNGILNDQKDAKLAQQDSEIQELKRERDQLIEELKIFCDRENIDAECQTNIDNSSEKEDSEYEFPPAALPPPDNNISGFNESRPQLIEKQTKLVLYNQNLLPLNLATGSIIHTQNDMMPTNYGAPLPFPLCVNNPPMMQASNPFLGTESAYSFESTATLLNSKSSNVCKQSSSRKFSKKNEKKNRK